MTLVEPEAELFQVHDGGLVREPLEIVVEDALYHTQDEEVWARNSGKVLRVAYTQQYGTGFRRLHMPLPVQSVVEALMADPETAAVVRRVVLQELALKVAGWVEES